MEPIWMVDLAGQYQRLKETIDPAIAEALGSAAYINGPQVGRFRDELAAYLNAGFVIPCGNGTDALQIALMALDLGPGDEVITTPFSFISSIEVISLLGLTPRLVDIDRGTFNINADLIGDAISNRTRAIIPVHLFGQCAEMSKITAIAQKHGLKIIEDTAQSIGADYIDENNAAKKAGTIGDIGCTSFFPSKNLGCFGDGGAIIVNKQDLHDKIRSIANHGSITKYYYQHVGVNSRLDTLQAAILSVKLKHLDAFNSARRKAADFYDQAFASIPRVKIPVRVPWSTHIFNQYTLCLEGPDRKGLTDHLKSAGIPSMVYYPLPLHLQEAYLHLGYKRGDFPVAEEMSEKVISLPMHTELSEDQLKYITEKVSEFLNKLS